MPEPSRKTTIRPPNRVAAPLLALTGVVTVLGILLWALWAVHLRGVGAPHRVPWWVLAVAFFVVERWPITLPLKSSRPIIVLVEIPLVIALFFSSPWQLLAGGMLGWSLEALLSRRHDAAHVAIDGSVRLLFLGVCVSVFSALMSAAGGTPSALHLQDWAVAYAATAAFNLSLLPLMLAIRLEGGRVTLRAVWDYTTLITATLLVNTALGLLAAVLLWQDPIQLLLAALPMIAIVVMYRSYSGERQRREAVEFLQGAGDLLHGEAELEGAIQAVLTSARRAFHAEVATLLMMPGPGGDHGYRTTIRENQPDEVMVAVPAAELPSLPPGGFPGRIAEADNSADLYAPLVATNDVADALLACLATDDRPVGVLLIGGHTAAQMTRFEERDIQMFRSLATQTTTVLSDSHVEQAVASLNEMQERLNHQAFHDTLTGLGNRLYFSDVVTTALGGAAEKAGVGVLFIDVDDFKTVNESLGYATGDELLVQASRRIVNCLGSSEGAARWDGDEFAVLVKEVTDEKELDATAQRILHALKAAPIHLGLDAVRCHASIGMTLAWTPDVQPSDLLRHADVAMHAAKAAGKDCCVRYLDGMDSAVVTRHQMRAELEDAVDEDQLLVYYQPVVDLVSGRITGSEALARWRHPSRGIVSPGEFIPLAEESGLIIAIGNYVLREACTQFAAWQREFPSDPPLYVSVNVSGRQLQQPNFVETVLEIVHSTGIDTRGLVIELTETILLEDSVTILTKLEALRRGGIRIALDDFGTGYSSLGYLRRLPIDILKIDKAFVDDLGSDASAGDFARAVVGIGNALKLSMIAEGIEETSQVETLRQLGCIRGQGFLMARPLPAAEVATLLRDGIDRTVLGNDDDADQIIPLRRPSP